MNTLEEYGLRILNVRGEEHPLGGLDDYRLTRENTEREVFSTMAAQPEMFSLSKNCETIKNGGGILGFEHFIASATQLDSNQISGT